MLAPQVERYLSLRRNLGYKLRNTARNLRAYARLADERGDSHIRASSAVAFAETAPSPYARNIRMSQVAKLARFLHAEDAAHEVPSLDLFRHHYVRPLPYIYTPEEISRIIAASACLSRSYPLRRQVYATLLGLIAATGLRISEALNLRLDDVLADGVLRICRTKFGKSRLVPMHPSVTHALEYYLKIRRRIVTIDDYVFISAEGERIPYRTASCTFRRLTKKAKIAPERLRAPRIHDLRHTFATRALEKCPSDRHAVSRHFVALSTYLGHIDIKQTYWYLEATPDLMTHISAAAEIFMSGGVQ